MTENLMPPNILAMLKPEYVTPAVVYLVSEDAPTGVILTAAAGVFAAAQIVETDGVNLGHNATADDVAAHYAQIADFTNAKHYTRAASRARNSSRASRTSRFIARRRPSTKRRPRPRGARPFSLHRQRSPGAVT